MFGKYQAVSAAASGLALDLRGLPDRPIATLLHVDDDPSSIAGDTPPTPVLKAIPHETLAEIVIR